MTATHDARMQSPAAPPCCTLRPPAWRDTASHAAAPPPRTPPSSAPRPSVPIGYCADHAQNQAPPPPEKTRISDNDPQPKPEIRLPEAEDTTIPSHYLTNSGAALSGWLAIVLYNVDLAGGTVQSAPLQREVP